MTFKTLMERMKVKVSEEVTNTKKAFNVTPITSA